MSIQTITANIQRYNKVIADITKKEGEQMKKRSTAQKKLNDLSKRMNGRNLSSSTINSILTQMERENMNMVDCDKKLASLANDKSRNQNYLIKEEEKLRKEQDRLNKEQERKRKQQEQKDKAKELQNQFPDFLFSDWVYAYLRFGTPEELLSFIEKIARY